MKCTVRSPTTCFVFCAIIFDVILCQSFASVKMSFWAEDIVFYLVGGHTQSKPDAKEHLSKKRLESRVLKKEKWVWRHVWGSDFKSRTRLRYFTRISTGVGQPILTKLVSSWRWRARWGCHVTSLAHGDARGGNKASKHIVELISFTCVRNSRAN